MTEARWFKEERSKYDNRGNYWTFRDGIDVLISMASGVRGSRHSHNDPIVLFDFQVNDSVLAERVGMQPRGFTTDPNSPYKGCHMDADEVKEFFDQLELGTRRPHYRLTSSQLLERLPN